MTRAWVASGGAAREAAPEEAVAAVLAGQATAWVDFDSSDDESIGRVLAPLRIHPLVIEDMVSEVNRPKVDDYGDYLYLVMHSARWDKERPTLREIDIVLGQRFLVTCHDGSSRSIAAAHEVVPRRPALLAPSPGHLLHFVLDQLVDHYLPIMDLLAERIDRVEDRVLNPKAQIAQSGLVHLKRGMSALRRILGPQRDTILALTRDEFRAIPPELRPYFRDVYDRLARMSDLLDSFRDETATILELQVTMTSNRMNEIIKRLTVLATLGLPLTVITSYYGMNFAFPEYRWPWWHAHLYALGLFLAAGALTYWYLKRNRML